MKKSTLSGLIILLCVLAWAGGTYVLGGQVRNLYHSSLEGADTWGIFSLAADDYRRGFLSSQARTLVDLRLLGGEGAPETVHLVFDHRFRHGPLPGGFSLPALAEIETRLAEVRLDGVEEQGFFEHFPELEAAVAVTRVAFDGSARGHLRIPPLERHDSEGELKWQGLRLDAEAAPGGRALKGRVEMPGLEFLAEENRIELGGMRGEFDLTEALPRIYVGRSKMSLDGLEMEFPDGEDGRRRSFEFKAGKVTLDSRQEGERLHYRESLEFARLGMDDIFFGPLSVDIELRNLDGRALSDFMGQFQEAGRELAEVDPETRLIRLLPLYGELAMKLLAGGPELRIERLHLVAPKGEVRGGGRLGFAGEPSLFLGDFAALLQQVEAAVELGADEGLVRSVLAETMRAELQAQAAAPAEYGAEEVERLPIESLEREIDNLLERNFVVREGGKLKTTASLKNGVFTLNGAALPIFGGE
jgi:uncharacterized protein YdgA (DUF945 family)